MLTFIIIQLIQLIERELNEMSKKPSIDTDVLKAITESPVSSPKINSPNKDLELGLKDDHIHVTIN